MSASHHGPTISTNKILKYIFLIVVFAVIYEFVPVKTSTNTDNKFLPANFSTENRAEQKLASESKNNILSGYKIIKIVDGDTIVVVKNPDPSNADSDKRETQNPDSNYDGEKKYGKEYKVRLLGINTPESVDPRRPVECFGVEASNYMKEVSEYQDVYMETDDTQSKYDKYGRLLAYVYIDDGQMLNRKMIAEGYAYEYTYDGAYKYQKDFKDLQRYAKNNSKGLWASSTCNGVK